MLSRCEEHDRVGMEPEKYNRKEVRATNQAKEIDWSGGAVAVMSNITDKQRSNKTWSAKGQT